MKKILIIEDQPDMQENLSLILRMEGYEVVSAKDGNAGLALARGAAPDLILCDVMMPGLDGYGVLKALRADAAGADTPFIFLTAKGERKDLRAGMNLGADDYLSKPVDLDELITAVRVRLERQQLRPAPGFNPDFSSSKPLEALGLTPREAEVLLWIAQGKTNPEIAAILGNTESTVKKHANSLFAKLGLESRNAATVRALEILSTLRAGS